MIHSQLPKPSDPRALRIAQALLANPSDNRPLVELCRISGTSKRTVERLFRKDVGMTFGRWRQQLRLTLATRLMLEGANVTRAATDAGYSTPSAFVSIFRKAMGTTPTKYCAQQETETQKTILAVAARSFREYGSDSKGISAVVKELGLTKDDFYRHFEDEGDLYAGAVARAFEEMGNWMVAVAEGAPKGQELRAIVEAYLSVEHLNAPGTGCALAALAQEIGRQPVEVRKRINQSMLRYRERMLPNIPGRSDDEKRGRFFVLFPGMAGVLATARVIVDPQARELVLAGARSFYLNTFDGAGAP